MTVINAALAANKPVVLVSENETAETISWADERGVGTFDLRIERAWILAVYALIHTAIANEEGIACASTTMPTVARYMADRRFTDLDEYPVLKKMAELGFPQP